MLHRPDPSDFDPFYATYVDRVPDGELLAILAESQEKTQALLRSCPEDREPYRYAEEKWSIREVVGHVIDTERLFAFRALHFARSDPSPLPGMDQEIWSRASNAGDRRLRELAAELSSVRSSTCSLFSSFDGEELSHTGVASGCRFTVRSVAWIIAGHEIHHRDVLERLYLKPSRGE